MYMGGPDKDAIAKHSFPNATPSTCQKRPFGFARERDRAAGRWVACHCGCCVMPKWALRVLVLVTTLGVLTGLAYGVLVLQFLCLEGVDRTPLSASKLATSCPASLGDGPASARGLPGSGAWARTRTRPW